MRLLVALLLIPITATAIPCDREHVSTTGVRAVCDGVLMPAQTAIEGARCVDSDLPACNARATRDAATCARRAVMMSRDVSESNARADRWRQLALAPAPALPPRVIVRRQGLPGWATVAIAAGAALVGGWVGWQASSL